MPNPKACTPINLHLMLGLWTYTLICLVQRFVGSIPPPRPLATDHHFSSRNSMSNQLPLALHTAVLAASSVESPILAWCFPRHANDFLLYSFVGELSVDRSFVQQRRLGFTSVENVAKRFSTVCYWWSTQYLCVPHWLHINGAWSLSSNEFVLKT